ncbi:hypothetical protein [Acidisoma sp. C75]
MIDPTGGLRRYARLASLALIACGLLAGCTTWEKPGASEADRDAAETHCQAVSHMVLPPNLYTTYSRGASYSDRKKCEKNSFNGCVKRGGRYYAIQESTTDANSDGRDSVFRDCMYQGGWREVPVN